MYKHFFKRFFDLLLSAIGIIVLLVPMIIIAITIVIDDPGPVFFKQKRLGKNKKIFTIYKFRTMYLEAPHEMATHDLVNPDKWITKVGHFLRMTSLDEIPQIFNIFIGQMSIVGPRPTLWNEESLMRERDKYGVSEIKPGLTGWAQINGRDILDDVQKAKYDGEYVQKCSFLFDAKCFVKTIVYVLKCSDFVEGASISKASKRTDLDKKSENHAK